MTTPRWNHCPIGDPLYDAMCTELAALEAAGWEGEGLYTMNREARNRWREHAENCPDCKIRKETK